MKYKTPEFIHRKGVVLSRELVPYDSALTFNAGISRSRDGYVMLFRNDYGFCKKDFDDFYAGISDNTTPKTNLGAAFSPDGVNWKVQPKPVFSLSGQGIWRAYDPRITSLGNGQYGVCFAVDTVAGVRGGIAVTADFLQLLRQFLLEGDAHGVGVEADFVDLFGDALHVVGLRMSDAYHAVSAVQIQILFALRFSEFQSLGTLDGYRV